MIKGELETEGREKPTLQYFGKEASEPTEETTFRTEIQSDEYD